MFVVCNPYKINVTSLAETLFHEWTSKSPCTPDDADPVRSDDGCTHRYVSRDRMGARRNASPRHLASSTTLGPGHMREYHTDTTCSYVIQIMLRDLRLAEKKCHLHHATEKYTITKSTCLDDSLPKNRRSKRLKARSPQRSRGKRSKGM